MQHLQPPKKILCIHDLSGLGRCSLSVILPVLSAMGHQVICLPTAVLSTHTGGLGQPARMENDTYGAAALDHYAQLDVTFDCIFSGYLATPAQAQLVQKAYTLWPDAYKIVDPAMGDHGKLYRSLSADIVSAMAQLARQADLILPNLTEAHLLLGVDQPEPTEWTRESAQNLADLLISICPSAIVTGIPMGKYLGYAGTGAERFVQKKLLLPRSYPGTGDLFAAVVTGLLLHGNALSAAADVAAAFVSECIQNTDPQADPRFGVWFEPQLNKLIFHA